MKRLMVLVIVSFTMGCKSSSDMSETYPEITNKQLRDNIVEYINKYNRKDMETLRNLIYIQKTTSEDTSSYRISNTCMGELMTFNVNFMTKVSDIYIGYSDVQLNGIKMSIEGLVNFMKKDYPFLKEEYIEYKQRLKEFPGDTGSYPTDAFDWWTLEGEAYRLKFVNDKLVEKTVIAQMGEVPISIERYD